ncbi:hypothetical protein [Micromonospora avicenniae]|uniref:hypothetical protein n=1 Tax=Micromonospora avicenniae TaxID=1198245 RepID=UPI00331F763A
MFLLVLACLAFAVVWTAGSAIPARWPGALLAYLVLSIALTVWLIVDQDAPPAFAMLIFGWGGAIALVRLAALALAYATRGRQTH